MVNINYLIARILSYYNLLCTEERINFKILHIVNFYDFVLQNMKDLNICIPNIKDVFEDISNSLNIIENDQNIHENLKYLLNDRINKYNEVYC